VGYLRRHSLQIILNNGRLLKSRLIIRSGKERKRRTELNLNDDYFISLTRCHSSRTFYAILVFRRTDSLIENLGSDKKVPNDADTEI
jgi:hypothetical protein